MTEGDLGNYTCNAENAIGDTNKVFMVKTRDFKVREGESLI